MQSAKSEPPGSPTTCVAVINPHPYSRGVEYPPVSASCSHANQAKQGRVPDAEYCRHELPISDVALKLGFELKGRHVRCPDDLSHWARVWMRKNQIKCFKCRSHPLSTIDLVARVLKVEVGEALRWIEDHFDVPKCRVRVTTNGWGKTRHHYTDYPKLKRPTRLEPSLTALRGASGWPKLTHGARLLATFFVETISKDTCVLATTYRELQAKVVIGNRGTVRRGLDQLTEIGLLQVSAEASRDNQRDFHGRFTTQTVLRLTWGSERFQAWIHNTSTATKYIGSKLNPVELRNGQETEPGGIPQKPLNSNDRRTQ